MTYIAEDIATAASNRTDLDAAMSATKTLYRGESLLTAQLAMAGHLAKIAGYDHVKRAGETTFYAMASEMFHNAPAPTSMQLSGRTYRLYEEK